MEFKTLLPGLFFSIGIFALKSGVGLNYYFSVQESRRRKALFPALFSVVYLLIFSLSCKLLLKIDILKYYDYIAGFMESGMTLHLILAILMAFWGVGLLKNIKENNDKSKSWLLLVLPCPVCIAVIFFSVAFILAVNPGSGYPMALVGWAGFIITAFLTAFFLNFLFGGKTVFEKKIEPEKLLGAAMLVIAGYFILSVCIMPPFSDAAKIYNIAKYKCDSEK